MNMTNGKWSKLILQAGSVLALLAMCLMPSPAVADAADIECSVSGALTISDVAASNIGYHSATISWKTNGLADSLVEYGTTTDYGYLVYKPTLVSEHSITLTDLSSSTTYHYRVKSATADGIQAISGDYTFTTLSDEEDEEEEEEEEEGEGGAGPGGGAPGYWVVIIDNLGKITEAKVSASGELLESVRATDAEGQIALELERGTKILCPGGKVPQRLEIKAIQVPPPQDTVVLDGVYRLDAYLYEYSRSPCLFTISPPGKLALSYDLSELPPNSLSVFTAYYDAQKGWVELSPGDITKADKLTVELSGPLIFTIMVKLGPPSLPGEPCFRPSNLVIEPGEAKPGQEISISLIVTNIGGAAGTRTLELKVDGEVRSVKSVTLEPGESQVVSFSIIEHMEGEHVVEIADLEGDFSIVIIFRPWWLLSTAAIPPVVVILERRRRWKRRVEWSTGLKIKDWLAK